LANHPSAKKRHRQSLRRRERLQAIRSRLRTERKKFLKLVEAQDNGAAQTQLQTLQKLLLRATDRNVIHRNKAGRILSRAYRDLNRLSG